jgi:hypothetical protein
MRQTNLDSKSAKATEIFEIISSLGDVSLKLDVNQNWYVSTQLNCRNRNIETSPFPGRSKSPCEAVCLSWNNWLKMQKEGWVIESNGKFYIWSKFMWKTVDKPLI